MANSRSLAEQTRSLIDRLNVHQVVISNQVKTITNDTTGLIKKSKSVSFLDDNQSNMKTSFDSIQSRSILKKQDDFNDDKCSLEPFVVNIPDNISRVDIDQYLKNVQDQRRKGLNYSYNTDDDGDDNDEEEEQENNESQKVIRKKNEPWNELKHWHSLLDEGNDRDVYYNTLRTSSTQQEQVWSTDNVEQIKKRIHERQNMSLKQQRKSTSISPKKQQTQVNNRQKVLLGYDFVAGLLDNEKAALLNNDRSLSESYLDELVSFRKTNLDQSTSYTLSNEADLADFSKELELIPPDGYQHSHTCIHSFTVNDRLFTVPTNADANGQSCCPICGSLRKEPNSYEPQYARVSVPKYRVNANAYKFRPPKRAHLSDLSTDSVALANHCLAGFNTARTAPLDKSAKSLDLRTDSDTQLELRKMSLEDAQRLGSNHDMCENDLRRRGTALRYHMNTLFQERLRRLRKTTNGADNNASVISQIDVR
ncbi:unnamed protein product [Adineta steineri]|uniref:Migration and invasion-inhibitory protein n=2 Tax=Adineta steineri TaxID=433720 RepID=A0A813UTE0_9BILA|nr:unnamed protein product [Adineta steineri]CAF3971358.1 unnamed protein product [Adineta steineri]